MKTQTLVVDDDPVMASVVESMLEQAGHAVLVASRAEEALELILNEPIDLVVSDIVLPGMRGNELMCKARAELPELPFVLMTGHGSVKDAVRAMQDGAFHYLLKPIDPDEFALIITRALEDARMRRQNRFLRAELSGIGPRGERLIGKSPSLQKVHELVRRVAPTDSTVLITGETGTGKELLAQTVHFQSKRADGPFIAFNCAAFNENLMESELFGHEKGAFTGATQTRRGRFEEADGGTIFLDEIGETSKEFQAKLLRVLQEREVERVGGNERIPIDVRVLASTNRDLAHEVREDRFREDLFYRLRVVPMHLPPLRERQEDIPLLATHFVKHYAEQYACGVQGITPDGLDFLRHHAWPGNIRELRHTIERAVVLAGTEYLTAADLEIPETASTTGTEAGEPASLQEAVDLATRDYVVRILDQSRWRKQLAAEKLGVDRATLYRMIKKYSISR